MFTYDDVLETIGDFGRYQKFQYVLLCLVSVVAAFHAFNMVFVGATPEHHCNVDPAIAEQYNLSWDVYFNLTIPWEYSELRGAMERASCAMYNISDYATLVPDGDGDADHQGESLLLLPDYTNVSIVPCQLGYNYSTEYYESTIVTEWDLVCDAAWQRNLADTVFFAGRLVGALLFGELSDRLGRKPVLIATSLCQVLVGCGAAFVARLWVFLSLYFVQGCLQCGIYILAFVLGTEIVGPSKRKFAAIVNKYFYSLGQLLLAGVAYRLRSWSSIELAISLPALLFVSYWWLLPESGRWLLSKGRQDEAKEVLEFTAKRNGVGYPVEMVRTLAEDESADAAHAHTVSILDVLRDAHMLRLSLIIWFGWFVNSSTYVGMALKTKFLAGDPYLNYFLSALVELPALTLVLLLVDRVGRRAVGAAALGLAGVACFATIFVPSGYSTLYTWLCLTAKFGITASYSIMFLMAAEIFPTVVRNMGMGVSAMCGHTGGIVAPLVMSLGAAWGPLPIVLYGAAALLCGASVLFLPETLGRPLPQGLGDLADLYRKPTQEETDMTEESPAANANIQPAPAAGSDGIDITEASTSSKGTREHCGITTLTIISQSTHVHIVSPESTHMHTAPAHSSPQDPGAS